MIVAESGNKTIACVGCGGWDAPWTSRFSGHEGAEHVGDLSQYCRDCKKVYDVFLSDDPDGSWVRMHPDDVDWSDRRVWYHYSGDTWWEDCPGDAYVHVGAEDTSKWLWRLEDKYPIATLYTVEVVGPMPSRMVRDAGDRWGRYASSYTNRWETPGRVSLYLPKSRLELVSRVELE